MAKSSLFKTVTTIVAASLLTLSVAAGAVIGKALQKPNESQQPGSGAGQGQGEVVRSVATIEKTNTYGLIDEYTITYTDGTTSIFIVTNGKDGEPGVQGFPGVDGHTPEITIDENGHWVIDGVATSFDAVGPQGPQGPQGPAGQDGLTPCIGVNGNWWIGETDTGVKAQGQNGEDGYIPLIGANGNWWIGGTDTGVPAQGQAGRGIASIDKTDSQGLIDVYTITYTDGTTSTFLVTNGADGSAQGQGVPGQDGHTPEITIDATTGNWKVDGVDTGVHAEGPQGPAGQNGISIHTGEGQPANDFGNNGDSYIDLQNWNYYVKDNGVWTSVGNIACQAGTNGTSIHTGSANPTTGNVPGVAGDTYIDLSTGDVYHMGDNGEWGTPDTNSSFALPHVGSNGNWWVGDTDTGVAAQGPEGQAGQAGTSIHTGSGNPTTGNVPGVAGDTYIDLSTGDVYHMGDNGEWGTPDSSSSFAIPHIGENGHWYVGSTDTGVNATGPQGPQGPAGASVTIGHGDPTTGSVQGKEGDTYIDLDTGYYYVYDKDNGWGEHAGTGAAATSVLTGSGEPTASTGKNGDSYINLANWDFYVKDNGAWAKVGNIKGEDGTQGVNGSSVTVGHGDPTIGSVSGQKGDTYIDLDTGNYYTMNENNEWGTPVGGGAIGASLRYGTTVPQNTLGNDGDSYINTDTWDYYAKINGAWVLQGNFAGHNGNNGKSITAVTEIDDGDGNDKTHKYEITYSEGDPSYFTLSDGTDGHTPTIEIDPATGKLVVDGTPLETKVVGEDGRGIANIEKTGPSADGLTYTYTITYTDASTPFVFTVSNGADGNKVVTSSGAPTVTTGYQEGDAYIDSGSWNYYLLEDNAGTLEWHLQGNIRGTSLTTGAIDPATIEGYKIGDSYLNLTSWDYFVLEDNAGTIEWALKGNIHNLPASQFTLKFDTNSGEGTFDDQIITAGEHAVEPTDEPTKPGLIFQGWYTAEGVKWDFNKSVVNHDTTLYAQWATFKVVDGVLVDCSSTGGVVIPEVFNGQAVTAIGDNAFKGKTGIASVEIPSSIKSIGNSAFEGCTGLTSIVIPSSVKTLGNDAFKGCSNLVYAFMENPSNTRRANGGLETIGEGAFANTGLKAIVIPNTVTSVGKGAFEGCNAVESYTGKYYVDPNAQPGGPVVVTFSGDNGEPEETNPTTNTYIDTATGTLYAKPNGTWQTVTNLGSSGVMFGHGTPTDNPNNDDYYVDLDTGIYYPFNAGQWDLSQSQDVLALSGARALFDGLMTSSEASFGYVFGASNCDESSSYVPATLTTVVITGDNAIDTDAFKGCSHITSFVVEGNPEHIGKGAFSGLTNLESITLPYIGYDSSLPAELTYSYGDGHPNITNPTTSIYYDYTNNYFYQYIDGAWVEIASATTEAIRDEHIEGSDTLPATYQNQKYFLNYSEGVLYGYLNNEWIVARDLKNEANAISNSYFGYVFGASDNQNQTAFVPASLTKIVIDGGNGTNNDTLPEYAFAGCTSITDFVISDNIKTIKKGAFANCTSLVTLVIPDSVETLGEGMINGCINLKNYTAPFIGGQSVANEYQGMSYLYNSTDFDEYNVENVTITLGNGVNRDIVPANAFTYCFKLKNVNLPNNIKTIETLAFATTAITSFTVPYGVESIGERAFVSCSQLKSIDLPDTLKTIGEAAFSKTGLTSLIVPGSVEEIGFLCFADNGSLVSIVINEGVQHLIHGSTFASCPNLKYVSIGGATTFENYNHFNNLPSLEFVSLGNGTQVVLDAMFSNCSKLKAVVLPNTITAIGRRAFDGCSSLLEIDLPEGLVSIGEAAFAGTGLTSVVIPSTVTSIDFQAFEGCKSLTTFLVKEGAPISFNNNDGGVSNVLANATSLRNFIVNRDITSIGVSPFYDCDSLEYVYIRGGLTEVPANFFMDCYSLKTVVLPETVTVINRGAFYNCYSLETFVVPANVKTIGEQAFAFCASLKDITFPEGLETICDYAFTGCNGWRKVADNEFKKGNGAPAASLEGKYYLDLDANKVYVKDGENWVIDNDHSYLGTSATNPGLLSLDSKAGDYYYYTDGKLISQLHIKVSSNGLDTVALPDSLLDIGMGALSNNHLKSIQLPFTGASYEMIMTMSGGENVPEDTDGNNDDIYLCTSDSAIYRKLAGKWVKQTTILAPNSSSRASILLGHGAPSGSADSSYHYYTDLDTSDIYVNNSGTWRNIFTSLIDEFYSLDFIFNIPQSSSSLENPANVTPSSLKTVVLTKGNRVDAYNTSLVLPSSFKNCTSVETVTIPDSVSLISPSAFDNCTSLKNVVFGNNPSLAIIGDEAFAGCSSLESFIVPKTVTTIGYSTFDNCTSLKYIVFEEGSILNEISSYLFSNCTSLAAISIPASVQTVSNGAFYNCTSLETIVIPNSVTKLHFDVFHGCSSLKVVSVPYLPTSEINKSDIKPSDPTDADNERDDRWYWINSSSGDVWYRMNGQWYKTFNIKTNPSNNIFSQDNEPSNPNEGDVWIYYDQSTGVPDYHYYFYKVYSSGQWDNQVNVNLKLLGALFEENPTTNSAVPSSLKTVIITNDHSGNYSLAFANCGSLETVVLQDTTKRIDGYEFYNCTSLKSANIPASVLTIDNYAFANCSSLESIVIPDNVTTIGDYAFQNCTGFTSLVLPNSLVRNGFGAFEGCTSLQSITLPFIGSCLNDGDAYSHGDTLYFAYIFGANRWNETLSSYDSKVPSSLKSVAFTSLNVISAGPGMSYSTVCDYAFAECSSLENIYITNNCALIGNYAFYGCSSLKSVVVPKDCVSVGKYAFANCLSLKYVYLPDELTPPSFYPEVVINFGDCVFANCASLEALVFPTETNILGHNALIGCTSLKTLSLPCTYIDLEELNGNGGDPTTEQNNDPDPNNPNDYDYNYWFNNITGDFFVNYKGTWFKLYTNTHRGEVKSGYDAPSSSGNLDDIYFSNGGIVKDVYVHDGNNWQLTLTMRFSYLPYYFDDDADLVPQSLKTVVVTAKDGATPATYAHMFKGCKYIENIILPDNATIIGNYAFDGCTSLKAFAFGENIETIGDYAFANTGLTLVVIPDNVTTIGNYAFKGCTSLTSFTLPESVTNVGFGILMGEVKWTMVADGVDENSYQPDEYNGSAGDWWVDYYNGVIYYKTDDSTWATIVDYGSSDFNNHYDDQGGDLPSTNGFLIGDYYVIYDTDYYYDTIYRLDAVSSIQSLILPSLSGSIGEFFGANTPEQNTLVLPSSLKAVIVGGESLGNYAFANCSNIKTIVLKDSISSIGNHAFENCLGLTLFALSENVTTVGDYAFANCANLAGITLGNHLTTIGDYAFANCANLAGITLGNHLTTIGDYAFKGCTSLRTFTIPNSVTSFGKGIFAPGIGNDVGWVPFDQNSSRFKVIKNISYIYDDPSDPDSESYYNGYNALYPDDVNPNPNPGDFVLIIWADSNLKESEFYWDVAVYGTSQWPSGWLYLGSDNHDMSFTASSRLDDYETLTALDKGFKITPVFHDIYDYDAPFEVFIWDSLSAEVALESLTVPFLGNGNGEYEHLSYFFGSESTTGNEQSVLPTSLKQVTITGDYNLKDRAFYGANHITSVSLTGNVTSLGESAFEGCGQLAAFVIPETVTSMGDNAFNGCGGLKAVVIPGSLGDLSSTDGLFNNCVALKNIVIKEGVTKLGSNMFLDCDALVTIILPDTITSIGNRCFIGCNRLENVILPALLTNIGSEAFKHCISLKSIYLPVSLTSIGSYAFSECTALTELQNLSNTHLESIGAYCFESTLITSFVAPETLKNTDGNEFKNCTELKIVSIPKTADPVVYLFVGCTSLEYVQIPVYGSQQFYQQFGKSDAASALAENLTHIKTIILYASGMNIGEGAFEGCTTLETFIVQGSMGTIGARAFKGCTSLNNISLPGSVTKVLASAFEGCAKIKSVGTFANLDEVAASAFKGCSSLVVFEMPETLNNFVGASAFEGCSSLLSIRLSTNYSNHVNYGDNCFKGCSSLKEIFIPRGLNMGDSMFENCTSLEKVTIEEENYVRMLPHYVFKGCTSLKSLTIPNNYVQMGQGAFQGCTSLETLSIPFVGADGLITENPISSGYTSLGYNFGGNGTGSNAASYIPASLKTIILTGVAAYTCVSTNFRGCSNVESIIYKHAPAYYQSGLLDECTSLKYFEYYRGTDPLSETIRIPAGVETVVYHGELVQGQFKNAVGAKYIVLDDDLTSIPNEAFLGCTSLESFAIPSSVTSIGDSAFENCRNLSNVKFPESGLTTIGARAFYQSGIENVDLESLDSIGEEAFTWCPMLKYVYLYEVNTIARKAFYNTSVEQIWLEDIGSIGENAFNTSLGLTDLMIDGVNTIGNGAFRFCDSLRSITMYAVNEIGDSAFRDCHSLITIDINTLGGSSSWSNSTNIGDDAFAGCTTLVDIRMALIGNIGIAAFQDCRALTYVNLTNVTGTMGQHAFEYCYSLSYITIGSGITSIGNYAFRDCRSLSIIDFRSTTAITFGTGVFQNCDSIRTVYATSQANWEDKVLANMSDADKAMFGSDVKKVYIA